MNTANLQLEGLFLAIASVSNLLVRKGVLTTNELDRVLALAENQASEERGAGISPSNAEAIRFPVRLLRLANKVASAEGLPGFSELAKRVGTSRSEISPGGHHPLQPLEGANPSFFADAVPPPARPDTTQGAILRGPTEDRNREVFQKDPDALAGPAHPEANVAPAHPEASVAARDDNAATVAITPGEAVAAFGHKS